MEYSSCASSWVYSYLLPILPSTHKVWAFWMDESSSCAIWIYFGTRIMLSRPKTSVNSFLRSYALTLKLRRNGVVFRLGASEIAMLSIQYLLHVLLAYIVFALSWSNLYDWFAADIDCIDQSNLEFSFLPCRCRFSCIVWNTWPRNNWINWFQSAKPLICNASGYFRMHWISLVKRKNLLTTVTPPIKKISKR